MRSSAKNSISISIAFIHMAISKVPLEQAIIDRLLKESRIPLHLLQEPNARVTLLQYTHLVTALKVASNDELLGHGKQALPLDGLSLLTHWLVSVKTMEQALNRLVRFFQLLGKGLEIKLYFEGELIHITIDNSGQSGGVGSFIAESILFSVHRILCWLIKEIFTLDHIYFQFEAPVYAKDYGLMFYGAPVSFNAKCTKISFPKSLLKKPVQQNLINLNQFLKDPISELLLLNFKEENWALRVANEIRENLNAIPTIAALAQTMKVKPYTLQRRLAEEGITYQDIKKQVKRDAAIELLVSTELTIEEISTRLGFSETSPFTRTFKEWTGIPPSAYRKFK